MTSAGFGDVELIDVREPVYYGRDVETTLAAMRLFADDPRLPIRL